METIFIILQIDVNDLSKAIDESKIKITMADFENALTEVKPAFGVSNDELNTYLLHGSFFWSILAYMLNFPLPRDTRLGDVGSYWSISRYCRLRASIESHPESMP